MRLTGSGTFKVGSIILLATLALPGLASSQPIPQNRRTDWTFTGVPGGIPATGTICTTLGTAGQLPSSVQSVTVAQINSAITACNGTPTNQGIVQLNAGTYNISGTVNVNTSYVTLRGAGADQTTLSGSGSIMNSSAGGNVSLGTAITAGGTKETRTITVASTANLSVGRMIEVDRADDPTYTTTIGSNGRSVSQVNMITAINGSVVTVRNPWFADFSSGSPRVKFYYSVVKTRVGVEHLRLEHNTTTANMNFWYCDSCWLKGVESARSVGYHFTVLGTLNVEFRDCYVHHGATGPNNSGINFYGNDLYGANSSARVENSIFNQNFPAIEINNSSSGLAILYNYAYGGNGGGTNGVSWTLDDGHAPMNIYNLYEGNITDQLGADNYYGGTAFATVFRNFITGYNPNFSAAGDAIWLDRLAYYYNILGNVIGSDAQIALGYTGCNQNRIYRLGYPDLGNCGTTPHDGLNVVGGYPDAKVTSTLFRWGNYDNFNKAVRWVNTEVPSDVAVPPDHTLPASLVYTSKPNYMLAGVAWPPIGPEVTGGNSGVAGHVFKIPAQLCWESRNLVNNGSFSAATCYRTSGSSTAPTAPTNLRIVPS